MVQLQQYLNRSNVKVSHGTRLPLLNSLFSQNFSLFGSFEQQQGYKTFVRWARKSPQLMGFLGILTADILSDQITFEVANNDNNKVSGRNKILRSEKFWNANNGIEVLEETLYDWFLHGIGYNWLGKLDVKTVKEFCHKTASTFFETKEISFKAQEIFEVISKDVPESFVKKLRHIPASTVSILNDETSITGYLQKVGVNNRLFTTEEVIPFKLMPFDGRTYPFPPMESLLSEIYLLWLITQNYVSLFENGGHPDKMFILPKELAGSKNHTYLIETLKKYKKIQNKHGNLVFTGDIKIEDMVKLESTMEHKELGLYLVGVLAMMYGLPAGRIPFLLGKAANLGDAGGLADSGYWRKISVWQSKIEAAYNNGLFKPYFGTVIRFSRGYKQDEVRETQTEMQKTQVVEQRLRLGLWTIEEAGKYLKIDPEVLEKAQKEKEERDEELASGMMRQNLNDNKDVEFEPDKKQKNSVLQAKKKNNNDLGSKGKVIHP